MPVVVVAGVELGADVVAMLAIVVLLASVLIARLLGAILSHLPQVFPLTYLNNAVGWFATEVGNLAAWLWEHCNPITALFSWCSWVWANVIVPLGNIQASIVATFIRLVTVTIPNAISHALIVAAQYANSVVQDVEKALTSYVAYLIAQINATINLAQNLYNAGVSFTLGWVQQIYHDVGGALSALNASLLAAIAVVSDTLARDISDVEKWVAGLIGSAVGAIAGALSELQNWIRLWLIPQLLAIGAAVSAIAIDWGNWRVRCGDPMCNGFSDLLNLVTGLDAVLDADLIINLLNDLRHDPDGVAREVSDALRGPVDAITGALGIGGG